MQESSHVYSPKAIFNRDTADSTIVLSNKKHLKQCERPTLGEIINSAVNTCSDITIQHRHVYQELDDSIMNLPDNSQ